MKNTAILNAEKTRGGENEDHEDVNRKGEHCGREFEGECVYEG